MKKLKNSKGFTLMEMLIVVAIIAILVAIAIPTFSNQLEKAREATDLANLRSAYAEVMACSLTGDVNDAANADVTHTGTIWSKEVKLTQKVAGWLNTDVNVGGITVPASTVGGTFVVSYDEAAGTATITVKQ